MIVSCKKSLHLLINLFGLDRSRSNQPYHKIKTTYSRGSGNLHESYYDPHKVMKHADIINENNIVNISGKSLRKFKIFSCT